ncbi:hypothetical protein VTK26DRAFT_6060 [Humicola hyalothermophila]
MAENVAQGDVANGGRHMLGPYGTGGLVVQSWADRETRRFGPSSARVMACIFRNLGATYDEVKKMIANDRGARHPRRKNIRHLPGRLSGQPLHAPPSTITLNGTQPGDFELISGEVLNGCRIHAAGQDSLGKQALAFRG